MKSEGRMLIIDQLNLFFRNYIVNPSLSLQGQPIGGLRGCIQSLQKLVRETSPDVIIICWDGAGGSKKRKLLQKDYKAGRKPIRLNRAVKNLSEQQEVLGCIRRDKFITVLYKQKSNTLNGEFLGRLVLGMEGDMIKVFGATIY